MLLSWRQSANQELRHPLIFWEEWQVCKWPRCRFNISLADSLHKLTLIISHPPSPKVTQQDKMGQKGPSSTSYKYWLLVFQSYKVLYFPLHSTLRRTSFCQKANLVVATMRLLIHFAFTLYYIFDLIYTTCKPGFQKKKKTCPIHLCICIIFNLI